MRNQLTIFHKTKSTIIYFSLFLSLLFIINAFRQTRFLKRTNNVCISVLKSTNKLYSSIGDDSKKNGAIPDSQEHIIWIKTLFDDQIPNQYYTHPEQFAEDIKLPIEIPGCLIDSVENTMTIPLVDFNPNVVVDQLMEMKREEPAERKKTVGATVKGMGGGKTRAFEEVRRRLLVRDKVLVVGITFNGKWSYGGSLDNWSEVAEKRSSLSYALSVISRMASVVFDMRFRESVDLMKKQIDSLPEYYRIKPDVFLRQFSSYLVERVSAYREIDTFIVLVDEVMKLEDGLAKKFSKDALDSDFTSVLRAALLEKYITIDEKVNCTLAISSLSNSPIGATSSGRDSTVLLLPDRLNSSEIVNKIFEMTNCSVEEKLLMENIAATVDTIPRLVEIMREYIIEQKRIEGKDIPLIDNKFIKNLIDQCSIKIDSRYQTQGIVLSDKILSAIVYGDDLKLKDEDTLLAISNNVISNSLLAFNTLTTTVRKVQTSLLMLWRVTAAMKDDENSLGGSIHRGISQIIEKLTTSKKEGDLLETILFEWMRIRIVAAMAYDQSSRRFNLIRLLGIRKSLVPDKYKKLFNSPMNIFDHDYEDFVVDIDDGSSRDNMKQMYNNIKVIEVSASRPIVMVRLIKDGPTGKEDVFDLLLVVHNPDSEYPFYIFLDTKSRREGLSFYDRPIKDPDNKDILDQRDQYIQTKNMMKANNESREFMFIYFRTHNVSSYIDKDQSQNGVVVELGRNDTKEFFGPSLFHFYVTIRNSLNLE